VQSTEKVRFAIAELARQVPELQAHASGMDAIMLAGMAQAAPMVATMLAERLPEDPAEVDSLLERFAEQLLALKSDPPELAASDDLAPGVHVVP
jgi:hypothetical protein